MTISNPLRIRTLTVVFKFRLVAARDGSTRESVQSARLDRSAVAADRVSKGTALRARILYHRALLELLVGD
jgi:hypothetical protein